MSKEEIQKGEMVDNLPNAKILIKALQNIGYKNNTAIADIVDNSIDAGANRIQIKIETKNKDFRILIADNGCGMSREVLDEALKLGSDTNHDDETDLGKFGMGLSTAGLSLGKRTTVITKIENGEYLESITDVDEIANYN